MSKNPAFLFYYRDFSHGTRYMTFEEKGAYIELLCEQADIGHLSLEYIKRILNSHFFVWDKLKDKFSQDENGLFFNKVLELHIKTRVEFVESRRQARLKCDEDSVKLYLIKDLDTKYVKIGSSVNPMRRFAEMRNQENPAITVGKRNYELIFESRVVPRSEEKVLHCKFFDKNIVGEWFSLSDEDIKYIRKTYEGLTANANAIANKVFKEATISNTNKEKEAFAPEEKAILDRVLKKTNIYALLEDFRKYHKVYPPKDLLIRVCKQFLDKGADIAKPYPYLKAALHRAAQDQQNEEWKKEGMSDSIKSILGGV